MKKVINFIDDHQNSLRLMAGSTVSIATVMEMLADIKKRVEQAHYEDADKYTELKSRNSELAKEVDKAYRLTLRLGNKSSSL